ncbi:hypothetical protein G7046_g5432 [Stylonectria norvegica]|nr:hypothetical protein G7046_g5432 [Stylonectria norvegica]
MERPPKRQRIEEDRDFEGPQSLTRPISPPMKRRRDASLIPSPWQLTWIRDLPDDLNKDAVTLKELLGDPLISECWEFNYLHDIHFLMDAFDPDTRHLVKVHVVHGFWKQEDRNRMALVEEAAEFPNVELHVAPMPEMFGTHHSKMMILLRHDDTAQIIIHTANMISRDWTNMTNAVWRSPLLPRSSEPSTGDASDPQSQPVGSGNRFKIDLMNYLKSYDRRKITCKALCDQLALFDFSSIKAALVASVPGKHDIHDNSQTPWGWPALKRYLKHVPCEQGEPEVVVQISSIATLGAKDDWLQKTLFGSLSAGKNPTLSKPKFKVVFPTADEIRRSLDGYSSGGSIHTKIQSPQQAKQLQYLRPIFHHWANDAPDGKGLPDDSTIQDSGRNRAAPHIKTYIRYNKKSIDWALVTSANLSKQAWGEAARPTGEVRVASWEIGVLIWPELLQKDAAMIGVFKSDTPREVQQQDESGSIIGIRIPYSTPLQRYGNGEVPWVATMVHMEPDWMAQTWGDEE